MNTNSRNESLSARREEIKHYLEGRRSSRSVPSWDGTVGAACHVSRLSQTTLTRATMTSARRHFLSSQNRFIPKFRRKKRCMYPPNICKCRRYTNVYKLLNDLRLQIAAQQDQCHLVRKRTIYSVVLLWVQTREGCGGFRKKIFRFLRYVTNSGCTFIARLTK